MPLLSEQEAISKAKDTFSTIDPNLVEKIVKDCYGKPLYFIKDHIYYSLKDVPYAFPGKELYREAFWSGYLYALIGEKENRDKETNIYGDSQQEQAVRTIVRDEAFDWNDNIENAAEKVRKLIDSANF